MADWVIERLRADHDRAGFCCGKAPLDSFLQRLVGQYEKRRLGRTFVAVQPNQTRVAGYYTIAAGSFDAGCLPAAQRRKLPKHPIPTVHLGRLAVAQAFRGQGLGETLLFHALRAGLTVSETAGAYAVDLWAIDEEARSFYARYGFLALEDAPLHLYLPMGTIESMLSS